MADQEQLAILRQGVDVWNAWRQEHRDIQPYLSTANLDEANLDGINLRGAHLRGAHLRGAHLRGAHLRGADLLLADLEQADLQGADLQGAFMDHIDLQWTNLKQANFQGARLQNAKLFRARLYNTSLVGSNLKWATLTEASLTRSDLGKTVLIGADFGGTTLRDVTLGGADMRDARIGYTVFADMDLRTVQNLDHVVHFGPSTIGIDTLYASHGDIPEGFLRGCGVRNSIIEYARSLVLAERPIDYYSCFISYSHADTSFARRLHDALQGCGIRCWLDEHQLLPGHSIFDEVDRGIRLWDKILLCASEHALKSWWVDNEIDKAFTKEQQLMQERGTKIRALIPLNLDGALWQWQDGKANQVRSRLAADFTGWEHDNAKFEREFERLVQALRTDEGREDPPKPKL